MKCGIFQIIAGVVLFVAGVIFIPLAIVPLLVSAHSQETQFQVPGTQPVSVQKAGRYYLWNDFQTEFEGKFYDQTEDIPEKFTVKITDAAGELLPFTNGASIYSLRNGPNFKKTLGYVEIKNVGVVQIEVSGLTEQRIFSLAPYNTPEILRSVLGLFLLTAVAVISGMALVISGIIKMVRITG